MSEYMTTREVAAHLRLNEKKIYAMATLGEIPAARVSGKWLFPRDVVDAWIQRNTCIPDDRIISNLLDRMLVVQGSDDRVLDQALDRYREVESVPVLSARLGSIAGLRSLVAGQAHLAGCHVSDEAVREVVGAEACYLLTLFRRSQGLIYDASRTTGLESLADVANRGLRFAGRQEDSGTWKLTIRLLDEADLAADALTVDSIHSTHLEVALAVVSGRAEVGMGSFLAASMAGLDFVTLYEEEFKLALPVVLASHPRMARFLDILQEILAARAREGVAGYTFEPLGKMETITTAPGGVS